MDYTPVTAMEVTTLAREALGLPPLPMLGLAQVPAGGATVAWPVVQGAAGPELLGDENDSFDWRPIP
jgi:hypothetical protein